MDRSYDESKNLLAETNAVVELMKYGAGGVDFSGLDVGRVRFCDHIDSWAWIDVIGELGSLERFKGRFWM